MTEQFYQVLKGLSTVRTADRAGLERLIEMAFSQQALRQHWVSGMTPALCPSFQVLYLLCWIWLLFLDNNELAFVFVWLQSGVLIITAIRWSI